MGLSFFENKKLQDLGMGLELLFGVALGCAVSFFEAFYAVLIYTVPGGKLLALPYCGGTKRSAASLKMSSKILLTH